jgi:Flp pilus assembly protein TadG
VKIHKRTEGQTLVETAIVLFLLLLILLGITEFARAWYTKNSLKNAARTGARLAVVINPATSLLPTSSADVPCTASTGGDKPCGSFASCPPATTPTSTNDVAWAVCCSPGVHRDSDTSLDTSVRVTIRDKDTGDPKSVAPVSGDTVDVCARTHFTFIVGNSPWPWARTQIFTAEASMRYE